jgi:hypothetical protein
MRIPARFKERSKDCEEACNDEQQPVGGVGHPLSEGRGPKAEIQVRPKQRGDSESDPIRFTALAAQRSEWVASGVLRAPANRVECTAVLQCTLRFQVRERSQLEGVEMYIGGGALILIIILVVLFLR